MLDLPVDPHLVPRAREVTQIYPTEAPPSPSRRHVATGNVTVLGSHSPALPIPSSKSWTGSRRTGIWRRGAHAPARMLSVQVPKEWNRGERRAQMRDPNTPDANSGT